jgi:transposase
MLQNTPLTSEELTTLEACSLHARHPRQRRRAQAILGHHRGHSLTQLADFYAVRYATVHTWLHAWQAHGLAGLAEGKRAGRPPKLDGPTQKK